MLKRWLLVGAVLASLIVPGQAIETEGLEPVGNYQSHSQSAQGLDVRLADGSALRLQWLAPDLVRVRVAFRKPFDPIDASWAIAKKDWSPVNTTLQDSTDRLVTSSPKLKVIVHKNPLRIEFQDSSGRVINRDHQPLMGDPKGVYKGKLFDPEAGSMLVVTKSLGLHEHFYGLGEKAHRLDRRRGHFTMWNSDTPRYVEGTDPIYQSIPFYVGLDRGKAYGIFYDNSHRSHFDMGKTQQEWAGYAVEGGEVDYYFFAGPKMHDVVARYTELTGRAYLPPRWALGHQASRWSYYPASLVEEVADTYQSHDLPLDVMTLDINYMQGYRVFTWDRKHFPDPAGLISRLAKKGLRTVTIVDPGVKYQPTQQPQEPGKQPELEDQSKSYYVYNQGIEKGYFVKRKSGLPMVTKVWPGESVFVDYTQEAARRWWGDLHRSYLDHGVAGIWTDMNEPADFIDQTGGNQRDSVFDDLGRKTSHAKNRNLVALLMARSTHEGLLRLRPNLRPYVITRAAYAGIQRYSTMWTGDAPSSWESLALSIPLLCNLGLSGESFVGGDVGGFMGRGDGELLTRAYQVAFLLPFCRNHKDQEGYDQEPWRFGPQYEEIIRKYLKLRYRFLPYLYAGIESAHRTGIPFIRPLVLDHQNDPATWSLDDQLMAGPDLLLAPILRPGQEARRVYLPKGTWYDFWTGRAQVGGKLVRAEAPLESVPLYVRGGAIVPMGPEKNTVDALPNGPLQLNIYAGPDSRAEVTLYEDDGLTESYRKGNFATRKVVLTGRKLDVEAIQGSFRPAQRPLKFCFYGLPAGKQVYHNGQPVAARVVRNGWEVTVEDSPGAHTLKF